MSDEQRRAEAPATCTDRDWLPDDEAMASGSVCGEPATHYSCNNIGPNPTGLNACQKHKCRCKQKGPRPSEAPARALMERPRKGQVRIITFGSASSGKDESVDVDEAWLRSALGPTADDTRPPYHPDLHEVFVDQVDAYVHASGERTDPGQMNGAARSRHFHAIEEAAERMVKGTGRGPAEATPLTWLVTRSSSNRYLGAYEWVRNEKTAAHFSTREAADAAALVATESNGGVEVVPGLRRNEAPLVDGPETPTIPDAYAEAGREAFRQIMKTAAEDADPLQRVCDIVRVANMGLFALGPTQAGEHARQQIERRRESPRNGGAK